MNPYLGNNAKKVKVSSYMISIFCVLCVAASVQVVKKDICTGEELSGIIAGLVLMGLFLWPILRTVRKFICYRRTQKIAGWLSYYEEEEVSFQKLETELGRNVPAQIKYLVRKGYLQNLKIDMEKQCIEIMAPNKQVEEQIYQDRICPYCGAKNRTVKGRVATCEFCGQKI